MVYIWKPAFFKMDDLGGYLRLEVLAEKMGMPLRKLRTKVPIFVGLNG